MMAMPTPGPDVPPRRLTDPRAMRALTHPVRLALLEVLTMNGTLTATAAGALIGETATTCSFHLRQLARYGFVEEAGGGRGRSRPWRLLGVGWSIDEAEGTESPASEALIDITLDRMVARHRAARAGTARRDVSGGQPGPARADIDETVWWVTPEELAKLREQIDSLVSRYRDRLVEPGRRPATALATEFVVLTHPMTVSTGASDGNGSSS